MKYIKMLTLETYQLTHPESLSDAELREILENVSGYGYVL